MIITRPQDFKRETYPMWGNVLILGTTSFIYAYLAPDNVLKITEQKRLTEKR